LAAEFTPYNESEYAFYINLCLENQYINDIEFDHYIDNGCFCIYCTERRQDIFIRAKSGEKKFEKIIHQEVINEVKNKKITKINGKLKALNEFINKRNKSRKFAPNQFLMNVSNK
jgi:hypothetical protein